MKSKSKKSAGKANDGNVTVDLGEKHHQKIERMIESKLATAGMAGTRPGLNLPSRFGGRPSVSGRPGMFGGGYKPWYSRFGKPWLGQGEASITAFAAPGAPGRRINIIPIEIQTVKTADVLTGGLMGLLGNRALIRLMPKLWPATATNVILNEGVAALAGLVPLLFKRNAMTVGVALPGVVYFSGVLVDKLYDAINMPLKPANMSGAQAPADPNQGARQRLAAIQQRINTPQASQRSLPRVMAVAQ